MDFQSWLLSLEKKYVQTKHLESAALSCTSLGCCVELLALIEGSLGVKLPTIWRDEKQSTEEAERRERLEERRVEEKQ